MFSPIRDSLRVRLAASMTVILALVVILSLTTFYALITLTYIYEDITHEFKAEVGPLVKSQVALAHVITYADMFMHADQSKYRRLLKASVIEVDDSFRAIDLSKFKLESERSQIILARREWEKVRHLSLKVADTPASIRKTAADDMLRLDIGAKRAQRALEKAENHGQEEVEEGLVLADRTQAQNRLILAVSLTLGFILSIVIAAALVRSIISPLKQLGVAAQRAGNGDFAYRLDVRNHDEIGRITEVFNQTTREIQESNRKLREIATHDELTGLVNRREFFHRLQEQADLSNRYQETFCLLLMDIDHFKAVNDTYGHQSGDVVLAAAAAAVGRVIRPNDIFARYGGEEFSVILPRSTKETAHEIAERIRELLAHEPIDIRPDQTISITVSIGVAGFPEDAATVEALIKGADQALYEAKDQGRNRTVKQRQKRRSA